MVANSNNNGTFTVTSGNGNITGSVVTGMFNLVVNPSGTTCSSSTSTPAGFYSFDNQLLLNQSALVTKCGLLFQFTNNSDFVNIYTDRNSGEYLISEDPNGASFTEYGGGVFTLTATPEPGSVALLGTGLVGLVAIVRRRRS